MTYDLIRHFADSWGLVAMTAMFVGFVGWTFRPGAHRHYHNAAHSILEEGERHDG